MSTTAWAYWAQTADHALIPLFKEIEKAGANYTIAVPTIAGFRTFTTSKGVNTSDLATLNSKGWKSTWADAYPYHFLKSTVKTTAVKSNQTIILDSYKTSPAGDWPLQMVYYMDGNIKAKDVSAASTSSSSSNSTTSTSGHGSSSSNSTTSASGHGSSSSNSTTVVASSTSTATDSAASAATSTTTRTHNHKRARGGKGTTTSSVDMSGIFNGTFGDSFYGQYNVTIPDTTVGTFGIAQAVSGWVNEPKWLKDTLSDLSINYTSLVALYPSFANLSTSRYTLFLPPSSSIPTYSGAAFESFVGKHLVKSLAYSPMYGSGGANLTAQDGSTIAWTDGGVNGATVLHRDVLTNAMVLQLIDQPFTN
ncbi:FAS1 domain [Phaffia rhodozyma]|uniref:FAS1 domain n=1 Tax=Phaffia rhodozyma TaxID=264483 RepID=A0A0F7SMJ2_PHARH|nr:FAS1 domain [Phaffia rhodozyma]